MGCGWRTGNYILIWSGLIKTPLLSLHLHKSHTEAITCISQIVTYAVRKKGMGYKGEKKVNFGRTMMQELYLLRFVTRHMSG